MFTGIIEEIGTLRSIERRGGKAVLAIAVHALPDDIKAGDSIAVDGVCLTVTSLTGDSFMADAVEETLSRSTLKSWNQGERVNVEYALRAGRRLGGHFVQGHVDGVGIIRDIRELEGSMLYTLLLPEELTSFCIEKGSIAIDGISLTIARLSGNEITVSIIPHTRGNTNLAHKRMGSGVNVEVDLIGKYVRRFLDGAQQNEGISEEFLRKTGFLD